jgi:hypothetical protein
LNDLFDLIATLAIQVQNLVSGFDKNEFKLKWLALGLTNILTITNGFLSVSGCR